MPKSHIHTCTFNNVIMQAIWFNIVPDLRKWLPSPGNFVFVCIRILIWECSSGMVLKGEDKRLSHFQ